MNPSRAVQITILLIGFNSALLALHALCRAQDLEVEEVEEFDEIQKLQHQGINAGDIKVRRACCNFSI